MPIATMFSNLTAQVASAAEAQQALQLAESGDAVGRLSAARRFRAAADALRLQPPAVDGLVKALQPQGGATTAAALRLLAAIGTEAATEHLLTAAGHASLALSQEAWQALVNLEPGDGPACRLLAAWSMPPAPGVGLLLARAIAQQPASAALLEWAARVLAAPPSTAYADVVIRGIAAAGNPAVRPWLAEQARSKRAEVQIAALGALLQAGHADGLDVLMDRATNGQSARRCQALVWLTGAPFDEVTPVFAAGLGDASSSLRQAALLGAPFVSDANLIPQALALLADVRPAVVHQAEAVAWLLTGHHVYADVAAARRQAIRVAATLPPGARSLLGRPLVPTMLARLLPHASLASCADAALRMVCATASPFRPDADLIRNLDAVTAWELRAEALSEQMPPGSRWYAGQPWPRL